MMKQRLFSITTALFVAMAALSLLFLLGAGYELAEMAEFGEPNETEIVALLLEDAGPESASTDKPAATAETAGWVIECADCLHYSLHFPNLPSSDNPRSLKVDSEGYIHIAHRDYDSLEYVYQDESGWYARILDTGLEYPGPHISLALDDDDYPHISYYDSSEDNLTYVYKDVSGWHYEIVDSSGWYSSLVLDDSGYPHISYQKTGTDLRYAYRNASGWYSETVHSMRYWDGRATSIALDKNGYPHISYVGYVDDLRYAHYNGSSWYSRTLDSHMAFNDYPSLALDENDYPYVSYYDSEVTNKSDLILIYQNVSGWYTQTVDSVGSVGHYSSLVLDGSGYAHISYFDDTNNDLKYAFQDISGWYIQTLDANGDVGKYTYLDLDINGYPHIAYLDSDSIFPKLKYTYQDVNGWHIQPIKPKPTGLGMSTSIALGGDGYPHIGYHDGLAQNLKYAYQNASGWHIQIIDDGADGNIGSYTSLALDGNGYPHISYYDATHGDLKYAYQDSSGWTNQTVDSRGDVGSYTSLALATTSPYTPHISYFDATNEYAKYAHKGASGWVSETVGTPRGGTHTSLALDADGLVHISYFDRQWSDLIYIKQNAGGDWSGSVVAYYLDFWVVGQFNSLALDHLGNPHISYFDPHFPALRIASGWQPVGWYSETVDNISSVYTSLEMDGGYGHISYYAYDMNRKGLRYAYQDASGWTSQTVDSGDNVGKYTSLALDGDGNPHISYFDDRGYLKYARIRTAPVANFSATPTAGPKPLTVHFSDASAGGTVTAWLWTFGDGKSSSQQNPSHIYQDTGLYSVKLTVTGPDGSDAITKSDYINVVEPALADFSGSPTSGLAPQTVEYINLSSGNFSTCDWDFGDGESSNNCTDPSHIYQLPGLYTVTLSIDGTGGPSVESKMAYINVNHPPPQVDFTAAPRSGETPLEVAFTSIVTGTVDDYHWSFGDGDQAHSANPTHTYHLAGTFSVTLLITGPGGADQVHYPNYIVVDPSPGSPQAEFSADLISGTVPLTVTFTAVITGTVESWEWDFGDGQKAFSGPVVEHTYLTPGLYDVSLTVSNNHGGVITAKNEYITAIKEEPEDKFIFLPVVIKGGS